MDLPDPEVSESQQLLIGVQATGIRNRDDVVRAGNWEQRRCEQHSTSSLTETRRSVWGLGSESPLEA